VLEVFISKEGITTTAAAILGVAINELLLREGK